MQDEKSWLRKSFLDIRSKISDRDRRNSEIFDKITTDERFLKCRTVLCYISVRDEPDTMRIIRHALDCGKTVGVPICRGNGVMEFRSVSSFGDLTEGKFGIPEPDEKHCSLTDISDDALCIVPGVVFDRSNHRIGYGGGYYDRFLADFCGTSVGICFSECITEYFEHGEFDISTDAVITDGG